jgi:hypothetical protein
MFIPFSVSQLFISDNKTKKVDEKARAGIKYVMHYERKHGRNPTDVSKNKSFTGFDIISIDKDDSNHRTIEVKATAKGGIPDAFETEFTRWTATL